MDSLCSAILAAYLKSWPNSYDRIHIPIAHIPRRDLALRPELSPVLREAGLTREDVLTLDDIPDTLEARDTRWFLVDHNAPVGFIGPNSTIKGLSSSGPLVIGVIDHRGDEGRVKRGPEVNPRIIRKCGSCASLVTEHFKDTWVEMVSLENGINVGRQLAHIALGPILTDTTDLSSAPKTTPTDVWAAGFAESHIRNAEATSGATQAMLSCQGLRYDRTSFFREISALKKDCSRMSYHDILRKDYKYWQEGDLLLGISTAPQLFDFLFSKGRVGAEGDLMEEFDKWASEQGADVIALMTTGTPNGTFQRELMVWSRTEKGFMAMDHFVRSHATALQLKKYKDGRFEVSDKSNSWRVLWSQGEIKESRKQVAPRLRDAMRSAYRSRETKENDTQHG